MTVDAMVALGYPFESLRAMTYSELREWLDVAADRHKQDSGA